jgi:hypothetical protein
MLLVVLLQTQLKAPTPLLLCFCHQHHPHHSVVTSKPKENHALRFKVITELAILGRAIHLVLHICKNIYVDRLWDSGEQNMERKIVEQEKKMNLGCFDC